VVVYVAPTRQVKTFGDLKGPPAQGDSDTLERIVSELALPYRSDVRFEALVARCGFHVED
jgi:hypothetical protein